MPLRRQSKTVTPDPAEEEDEGVPQARLGFSVRGLTSTLVVPQGFTLSIAGTLAGTIGQRGTTRLLDVWLFVVGAGFSFCLLAIVSGNVRNDSPSRPLPIFGKATLNILPIAVMPAAVVSAGRIANSAAGFFVAGALATGLYVGLLAIVLWLTARRRAVAAKRQI